MTWSFEFSIPINFPRLFFSSPYHHLFLYQLPYFYLYFHLYFYLCFFLFDFHLDLTFDLFVRPDPFLPLSCSVHRPLFPFLSDLDLIYGDIDNIAALYATFDLVTFLDLIPSPLHHYGDDLERMTCSCLACDLQQSLHLSRWRSNCPCRLWWPSACILYIQTCPSLTSLSESLYPSQHTPCAHSAGKDSQKVYTVNNLDAPSWAFVVRSFISMISKVKMQEKIQKDLNSKTSTFALIFCMWTPRWTPILTRTPTLTPGV